MSPEQFAAMCRAMQPAVQSAPVDQLHSEAGDIFREAQADNFASAADEHGNAWPPRKHKYPWPILRKTKRMMNAASRRGAAGNITTSQAGSLILGIRDADVPYSKFHQRGTRRLPVRRFFYLKQSDRRKILPPVRSHLLSVFLRTRGRFSRA
jgi:phage gpG-like protein